MTERQVHQWLITAPQPVFEVVLEAVQERSRQETDLDYTPEHDDAMGGRQHLVIEAGHRVNRGTRQGLVEAIALLIAAVEAIDRTAPALDPMSAEALGLKPVPAPEGDAAVVPALAYRINAGQFPGEVLIVADSLRVGQHVYDELLGRSRVRQQWFTNGARRAELENGTVVRLASRDGLRGRTADLVLLVNGTDEQRAHADLVVAARPRGEVLAMTRVL